MNALCEILLSTNHVKPGPSRETVEKIMITKTDQRYFQKAYQTALLSDYQKTHVGCVAVYQGSIISIGCNTIKTHPLQKKYNRYRHIEYDKGYKTLPRLHAEINCLAAIRDMDINFSKVKLYIYRAGYGGVFKLARPCPSCMAAIRDIGIKHVYYTTDDGYAYEKIE